MGDRLVSVAAGTMLDVGPAEAVDVAAAAGWPAVGLWFDPETWDRHTTADVRQRLEASGLVALDIEPVILQPAAGGDLLVTDAAARLVDAGGEVGARHVLVASRDPDHGRVAEAVHDLCERAAPQGLRVVLEFLPIMTVRTLDEAVAIVERVDHPGAGVLVDALHLVRSGGRPDEVADVDPRWLPYAQLCDVAAERPDDVAGLVDEALHGRLLPGDGVAPLAELIAVLPADAALSLEMRSRTLMDDHPDPIDRVRVVLDATRRLLSAG